MEPNPGPLQEQQGPLTDELSSSRLATLTRGLLWAKGVMSRNACCCPTKGSVAVGELKGQSHNKETASFINEALPQAGEGTGEGEERA